MKGNAYYFSNKDCPYFPCHPEIPEQNCKFCYCPLYYYKCIGQYTILPNGIKDCSNCKLPHTEEGAKEIVRVLCNEFDSYKLRGFPPLKELANLGTAYRECQLYSGSHKEN